MTTNVLLQPLKLGPYTLKNRIFLSALTRNRAVPTNVPNALMEEYYKQRSNAGLIVTEGTLVTQQGTEWPNAPGIWNQDQVKAWKKITDTVHAEGSTIYTQLWHVGRVAHPDMPEQKASGQPVYGPSAIAAQGGKFRQLPGTPGYVTPTELPDPTIIIDLFRKAAINAKEAGFDGVELHGANGYIIHQFLDTSANLRTDKWGGSIENRSRLGLEILKVLIEVFDGIGEKVGVKLSPCGGYNDVGMPLEETLATFNYFISEAIKLGVGYIALVRHLPLFDPMNRGTKHDVIASYNPLFKGTKTKLFTNAGYTPAEALQDVTESAHNNVEGVFFGQLFISHPDLAKRVEFGKELDNQLDYTKLYGHGGSEAEERGGYVDYPAAKYN